MIRYVVGRTLKFNLSLVDRMAAQRETCTVRRPFKMPASTQFPSITKLIAIVMLEQKAREVGAWTAM
jgi:hypothetical protein